MGTSCRLLVAAGVPGSTEKTCTGPREVTASAGLLPQETCQSVERATPWHTVGLRRSRGRPPGRGSGRAGSISARIPPHSYRGGGMSAWETLGAVPPGELAAARVELHWAAQAAAAVGKLLLPPRGDASE